LHRHNWLSFGKFQDTERFLIHCARHFSSRLPPSGGTCKYAKAPSTKKIWEILYILICSFLPCLYWLLRNRVRKFRRDLWITLYIYIYICTGIYAAVKVNFVVMLSLFRQRFTVKYQWYKSTKILRFMPDKRTQRFIQINFLFEEIFAILRCSGIIVGHVTCLSTQHDFCDFRY